MKKEELYEDITNILMSLKMQPEITGFEYLREGIGLCCQDKKYLNSITLVYSQLAKNHKTTPLIVERSIRTAIENAYINGGILGLNELYDTIVYNNDFKPTNGELILTIVDIIKLNNLKKSLQQLSVE